MTSTGGLAASRLARELERAGVKVEALTTEALRWRVNEKLTELDARTTIIHDEAARWPPPASSASCCRPARTAGRG